MSYYNTTNEFAKVLETSKQKAKRQDEIILNAFKQISEMTPSEVWTNFFDVDSVPITSVRRAMTDLTNDGKLIKTEVKKKGIYGKPEYVWQLKAIR
jgi:hypothetical protein